MAQSSPQTTPRPSGRARRSQAPVAVGRPDLERVAHGDGTRELILATAERLFAEQSMGVSNRQISEAAGQANNSAVAYHFGSKADLVLAILHRHAPAIEQRRSDMLEEIRESDDLRRWIECVVCPITDHLESLGTPSWYARFIAHVTTDPALRQVVYDDAFASRSMRATIAGTTRLLPKLPAAVRAEREDMTRYLIVHLCSERERALSEQSKTARATWTAASVGLVDALVGLWQAPFSKGAAKLDQGRSPSSRGVES